MITYHLTFLDSDWEINIIKSQKEESEDSNEDDVVHFR